MAKALYNIVSCRALQPENVPSAPALDDHYIWTTILFVLVYWS